MKRKTKNIIKPASASICFPALSMSTEQECCGYVASYSPGLIGHSVCVRVCVCNCVCVLSGGPARRQGWTHGNEQSSGPSLFEAVSEPAASERTRPEVTMTALRCSSSPTQTFPWVPSMCWIAWRKRKAAWVITATIAPSGVQIEIISDQKSPAFQYPYNYTI